MCSLVFTGVVIRFFHQFHLANCCLIRLILLLTSVLVTVPPVQANGFSLSGFGTIGFAQSDKSFGYQRYINDSGTLRRDSVAGLQLDAAFGNRFGTTVQLIAAPASDSDDKYKASISWAFVSWRPTNDLLIRVGRQRIPLYLFSQNYDVGATYELARLPTEMYSISPGNEFNGISLGKSFNVHDGDISIEGYWGTTNVDGRFWIRDGVPQVQAAGSIFRTISLTGKGLILSYKKMENTVRFGIHGSVGRQPNGSPLVATYPFVELFPGVGYFQVDPSMPGPGVPTINSISNTIATIGADVALGNNYRVIAEFARTYVNTPSAVIANASDRGYLALSKRVNRWTPYVSYAFLRSDSRQLNLYESINNNTVPMVLPGAALINASQRTGADSMLTYDQRSIAFGASYSLSATSKIKGEVMHARIGRVSSLVDGPPGRNIRNQHINVISFSYSMVF
jgi:hypothetical protein